MTSPTPPAPVPAPARPPLPAGALARAVDGLRAAGCVFAEEEAGLLAGQAASAAHLAALVARRASGLPLEQVLGWAELAGVRVAVAPGVFVPRRRSELLVVEAAALARAAGPGAVVVDLCCGTGAVGLAVAAAVPGVRLHAADVDPAAVACAAGNLAAVGGQAYLGDLYAALPDALRGAVDVLVANAPYVPTAGLGLLPAEARLHEPVHALDGGPDGTALQRRVAAGASGWLAPGGHLLVETGAHQAALTARAFADHGLAPRTVHDEGLEAAVVAGVVPDSPTGGAPAFR